MRHQDMNNAHEAPVIVDAMVIMRPRLDKIVVWLRTGYYRENHPASGKCASLSGALGLTLQGNGRGIDVDCERAEF